jgi:predicted MFS family arabinose efflux permease
LISTSSTYRWWKDRNELRLLVSCAGVYCIGNVIGYLTPQVMFGAIHRYDISAAQAGLLSLAEGVTFGSLMLLLGSRPPAMTYRTLAIIGIGVFVAANTASPVAPTFNALLALRVTAGIADAIMVFVAASLISTQSENPERAFSILTIPAYCGQERIAS